MFNFTAIEAVGNEQPFQELRSSVITDLEATKPAPKLQVIL